MEYVITLVIMWLVALWHYDDDPYDFNEENKK